MSVTPYNLSVILLKLIIPVGNLEKIRVFFQMKQIGELAIATLQQTH